MSWLSLLFEGAVSVLLLVMIAYSIKLNRLLGGLRERDAEIENLLNRFKDASDQAESSVAVLKAAGVEAERSVRVATERAEIARDQLDALMKNVSRGEERMGPNGSAGASTSMPSVPAPVDSDGRQGSVYPPEFFENQTGSAAPDDPERDTARSESQLEMLRAIRAARVAD